VKEDGRRDRSEMVWATLQTVERLAELAVLLDREGFTTSAVLCRRDARHLARVAIEAEDLDMPA
jgi:hypothetical protein